MVAKRRKLNITDLGTATEIGSSEWDYEIGYMTGDDQSVDDPVNINTITTFYNQRFAWKSAANNFKYLVETGTIAADRTITFPVLTANGKFVIDSYGNVFTVAQLFDAAIKTKPITTPTTDASYGQFFCHSADSNKPKFVKPDGTLLDLSAGTVTDIPTNFSLSGDISPSQITANQNDYNPTGLSTASRLRLTTDASRNITGLAGGSDGRVIIISNVGSFDIVLTNQDTNSTTAGNRFLFGSNITLHPDQSVALIYDSTTSRWRLFTTQLWGFTNLGSGAGLVFKQFNGVAAELRSILAGSGITVTNNTNDITISASGGGLPTNGQQVSGKWGKIGFHNGLGILAGVLSLVKASTPTVTGYRTSTEHGLSIAASASNVGGGLVADIQNLYRELEFTLTVRWQLIKNASNGTNLWIGVTSDLTAANFTASTYANNINCLLFGKKDGDTTWSTYRNDGSASATSSDTKTENETINTVILTGGASNMTVKFNSDSTSTYTTIIPSTTTALGIIVWMNAESATAKELRILDIDLTYNWKTGA